jgi:hypothetical protein
VAPAGTGGVAGTVAGTAGVAGTEAGTGIAGMAGTAGVAGGAGTGGNEMPEGSECLAGIESYNSDGPFQVQTMNSGSVKMWVPDTPAGCKVPVIHLANGTGGTCNTYAAVHRRLGSHGFIATCYENANTGAGTQGRMALMTAVSMFPDKAAMRFGSTGHSQGGQAAFVVLAYAEEEFGPEGVYAGLAIEPASGFGSQPTGGWTTVYGRIKSPMFMFSGTADGLVSRGWVSRGFAALADSVEAYHWSAVGATHVPVPNSETNEVAVPWFRWKLLGDKKACMAFKALEGAGNWNSVEEQNATDCN